MLFHISSIANRGYREYQSIFSEKESTFQFSKLKIPSNLVRSQNFDNSSRIYSRYKLYITYNINCISRHNLMSSASK